MVTVVTPTWEDSAYRCQICMQIFSDNTDMHDMQTPMLICENNHDVCRACSQRLTLSAGGSCPTCRIPLKKIEIVPNRQLVYFLSIANMACGGCSNPILMHVQTAIKHAKECAENHVCCPLLNDDANLSRCSCSTNVSKLWEHCQEYHCQNISHPVTYIEAMKCSTSDLMHATLSLSVSFSENNYIFFAIRTPTNTYNMLLHITKDVDNVIFSFRRFFPEILLSFKSMYLSLEIGDISGMIMQIPCVVSSYISITEMKELKLNKRMEKMIEIPHMMLYRMSKNGNSQFNTTPPMLSFVLSAQFYFQESM